MADIFTELNYFQVYNYYRNPDAKNAEKVLRTFGEEDYCKQYKQKWDKHGNWLNIEPYNPDEWNNPKYHNCCILPLEQ